MKMMRWVLMAVVVVGWAAAGLRADGPPKKGEGPKEKPVPGVFRMPKHIEPTAEQQVKLDALVDQCLPKLKELAEREDAVFTAEQKAARDAARKAAHAEGLRGPAANERVEAAVTLSEEQAARRAEARKAKEQFEKEIRAQVISLLTDEQKQSLDTPKKDKPEKKGPHPKKPGPPEKK